VKSSLLYAASQWAISPWVVSVGLTLYFHYPMQLSDWIFLIVSYPVYVGVGTYILKAMERDRDEDDPSAED